MMEWKYFKLKKKYKLKKVQETIKCSYCGESYHNKASCDIKKSDDKAKEIVKVLLVFLVSFCCF